MDDLVKRAAHFATQAHRRIDQRRKYTSQPVEVHLKAVAEIVANVSDDPEMIAAAWLHDTVEDTPATLGDVEREFGRAVRDLVAEVTDVSRPSDGNRAVRKAIDHDHLVLASARGKTVKLADLIDNCGDICQHDPRFGRVFLVEMAALLDVFGEGDPKLLERARRLHRQWSDKLETTVASSDPHAPDEPSADWDNELRASRTLRRFAHAFTATDIAEPLRSFDRTRPLSEVAAMIDDQSLLVAGVRARGRVVGFLPAEVERGADGTCDDARRDFAPNQVVEGHAPISVVIDVLTIYDACFVRTLDDINGIVTRAEMQKPIVRMWLFGIITYFEMRMDERIRGKWTEGEWKAMLPTGRLEKARELRDERIRRGEPCELIDCLQIGDRAQLLVSDADQRSALGFSSKAAAARVLKELQSLRNKLAHAQDIVTHDWAQIARLARRIAGLGFDR